ncbi:MAG: hypothetical protein NZ889_01060 [Candidatus Pacearchaeota archaeon]|nr:hypothetical protein [Candidatus Pacearchaeota archaeon]
MICIYEIPKEKLQEIKKIIETPDQPAEELDIEIEKEAGKGVFEKAKKWKENEFKKQEVLLREAKTIGIETDSSFLYIKGSEEFFKKNESLLIKAGAKKLEGKKGEEIRKKIEEEETNISSGVGFIFS